tara:strand:+ start:139 stop:1434 length:1296 start_codon:yes stop_codon:yes gene_type:complete
MKKIIIIISLILISTSPTFSATLKEALIQAYNNNTELNAERENLNISKEELNISKSNYLPSVTLSGSKSKEETNKLTNQSGGDATITDVDPTTTSIKLEQTLIDFGRGADYQKNKIGINLAQIKLLKKEQDILYRAVEAYTGLIFANEKYLINGSNVKLLERQVEADKVRLERGQITISDLAQSESSLAGAKAKYIEANSELLTSKLNYENVIGPISAADSLKKSSKAIGEIPKSVNSAIELAKTNNPDLIIAKLEYEQSEKDLSIARSDLLPTSTLTLERSYTDDLSATYDEKEKDVLKATVSWPFYSGGKNRAKVNKNQNLKTRKRLLLDNEIKSNQTSVASAWSNLQASESFLNSVRAQVKASKIAYEGITAEYERGSGRTTLDVIQSNSLLLNAQISLANSERNYLLSQYNLLKIVGLLNSDYLKLK